MCEFFLLSRKPEPAPAPLAFAIFSSIKRAASGPRGGTPRSRGVRDVVAAVPESLLLEKRLRARRGPLPLSQATAVSKARAATGAQVCRTPFSSATRSAKAADSSSTLSGLLFAVRPESCSPSEVLLRIPQCDGPGTAAAPRASAPCSFGRLCSKCRPAESISGPTKGMKRYRLSRLVHREALPAHFQTTPATNFARNPRLPRQTTFHSNRHAPPQATTY